MIQWVTNEILSWVLARTVLLTDPGYYSPTANDPMGTNCAFCAESMTFCIRSM